MEETNKEEAKEEPKQEQKKEEVKKMTNEPYFVGKVWQTGGRRVIGFPKGVEELKKGDVVYVYKSPQEAKIYNQDLSTPFCTLDGSQFKDQLCKVKKNSIEIGKSPNPRCTLCLLNQLLMKLK